MNDFVYVSVVDPPDVEPALAMSVPDVHGKQHGLSVSLAAARKLVAELEAGLGAAERIERIRREEASRGHT